VDYSQITNDDLKSRLEDGALVAELEATEGWKVMNEACKRVGRTAERELLKVKASDTLAIIELQVIAKLYSSVIPSLINSFKQESRIAFDELVDRGVNLTE
jgi:hypothetical protein